MMPLCLLPTIVYAIGGMGTSWPTGISGASFAKNMCCRAWRQISALFYFIFIFACLCPYHRQKKIEKEEEEKKRIINGSDEY